MSENINLLFDEVAVLVRATLEGSIANLVRTLLEQEPSLSMEEIRK